MGGEGEDRISDGSIRLVVHERRPADSLISPGAPDFSVVDELERCFRAVGVRPELVAVLERAARSEATAPCYLRFVGGAVK